MGRRGGFGAERDPAAPRVERNTSLAAAGGIPNAGCQIQPRTIPAGFIGSRTSEGLPQRANTLPVLTGCRCLHRLLHGVHLHETTPLPSAREAGLGLGTQQEGWGRHPASHQLSWHRPPPSPRGGRGRASSWPGARVPYRCWPGADAERMSHCFPAPRPLPVPVGPRDKQKRSQTLWGGGPGLLPSSRSCSSPLGRQADRRMPALGEWAGTPLFLAASAPHPLPSVAKNTQAGWTGKIIKIKETSRPCFHPLPPSLGPGQVPQTRQCPHPGDDFSPHPHPAFPVSTHRGTRIHAPTGRENDA